MSASLTGELSLPLVHRSNFRCDVTRAISPASRMAASKSSHRDSLTGNGQALYTQHPRVGSVAEVEILRRREILEDVGEMAGDRDLAHGISNLAVLDPEARRAAAVVAGDHVRAHADQIGDVESVLDVGHQFTRSEVARRHMQIGRGG